MIGWICWREAYNTIISNDENKDKFKVILNTLMNLYEASRPGDL